MQWYGNTPGVGKGREKRAPGISRGESQIPVVSDVVVWASTPASSQFTHVTVAPTGTAIESGWNAKLRIAMM